MPVLKGTSSRPGRVAPSLPGDTLSSLRNPEFWAMAGWLDVVVRYRQSRLGILWLIVPAAVYTFGLGAFFASMFGAELERFAAHVALGWLVFRLVNTVIIEATGVFAASAAFIMDGQLRLTDFVLRVIGKSAFYLVAALPVAAIALMLYPEPQWWGVGLLVLTLPVVLLNLYWIAVVFALAGARFPDIGQIVTNLFIFAFLFTPIIWYAEFMPAESIRGKVMRFNPLFHLIEMVRAPILGHPLETSTLVYVAVMSLGGTLLATVVYRRYASSVPLWV